MVGIETVWCVTISSSFESLYNLLLWTILLLFSFIEKAVSFWLALHNESGRKAEDLVVVPYRIGYDDSSLWDRADNKCFCHSQRLIWPRHVSNQVNLPRTQSNVFQTDGARNKRLFSTILVPACPWPILRCQKVQMIGVCLWGINRQPEAIAVRILKAHWDTITMRIIAIGCGNRSLERWADNKCFCKSHRLIWPWHVNNHVNFPCAISNIFEIHSASSKWLVRAIFGPTRPWPAFGRNNQMTRVSLCRIDCHPESITWKVLKANGYSLASVVVILWNCNWRTCRATDHVLTNQIALARAIILATFLGDATSAILRAWVQSLLCKRTWPRLALIQ